MSINPKERVRSSLCSVTDGFRTKKAKLELGKVLECHLLGRLRQEDNLSLREFRAILNIKVKASSK